MDEMGLNLLQIAAYMMVFLYGIFAMKYAAAILDEHSQKKHLRWILAAVNTTFMICAYSVNLPYSAFYLGLLCLLFGEFKFFYQAKISRAYFGAINFVINIMLIHMIVIALISHIAGVHPSLVMEMKSFRWLAILIVFIGAEIVLYFFQRIVPTAGIREISNNTQQTVLVALTATFIMLYTCFDSFLLNAPLRYKNLNITLIETAILSLVNFYLLLSHALKISNTSHFKEEATALERALEESIKTEERLRMMAFKDNLTGCYSRTYITQYLDELLKAGNGEFCLIYLDLDKLKQVNDNFGHNEGDSYLLSVSRSLSYSLRENDVLARMGGDEFMIVLNHCTLESAQIILQRAQENLTYTMRNKIKYTMSISAGIVFVDKAMCAYSKEKIIEMADQRMYKKKQNGITEGL